jgi:Flp pilus assembly protein TadD
MGKVIKYTNNRKKGSFCESSSEPSMASPKGKRKGKFMDAIEAWSEADIDLHRELLQTLMEENEFSQAKIVAKHLTDLRPDDSYAWYLRGVVLLALSDPENAETCLLSSSSTVAKK